MQHHGAMCIAGLLKIKYYCPLKILSDDKIRADSIWWSQPILVNFEFPHKKYNHEQKYKFFRTAGVWSADKIT